MPAQHEMLRIFEKTGAMLKGHFELSSGLHSERYLQCALVLQHPEHCEKLCSTLARKFAKEGITVVIAPALGGIIVSYEIARALGVRSLFSERTDGTMALRRGFCLEPHDRVLVVEDVVTTGLSTNEVLQLVRESGAQLAGIGAIVDRSSEPIDFGVRFEALIKIAIPAYHPEQCPLCAEGLPLTKPGSRTPKS